ncbi:acyl-CoA dehydrogenase [Noviherbaspirillum cavernae]|uniref:Acyl-CoA dehydrogenase n=1 Tax=Noviherbaspirillum cavernae TaxID=2320862 RepID=A0A418X2W3_9BURK|nr:acyl-CoA dehydrogenase [Noviherbaspirillum cavernae]RJG06789.1 acyl-CoA dehydrogenase [Noviherbaspirillum cavernae]
MHLSFSAADEAFRAELRAWLDVNLCSVETSFGGKVARHSDEFRLKWDKHLGAHGWTGLNLPQEYGGRNLPLVQQAIFHEEYARAGAPQSINSIGQGILAPTLAHFGSEAQKRRFLAPLLRNEEIWCQGYSEPGAGSDLASLATRAVRDGDHYVISGQKIWTSFAQFAHWCFVLVRTDATVAKHKGISFLLVDMKSPGITVKPIHQMNGEEEFNEVFFDNVRVPVENLVGAENDGWRIAMAAASFERGTYFIPRQVKLQQELRDIVVLAQRTVRNGRPVIEDPVIADRLARLTISAHVMRVHAYRVLTQAMRGEPPGPEASYTKLFWSETHQALYELAADILGPDAAAGPQDSHAPRQGRWMRDYLWTRAESILAGTSEIQRNIIGERALDLPR